ncbi:UDP-N-acetylenolpyruvoylglucosamine reductase [Zobellella endophytica]|uniref:UDP-N-acetylenolpyruvoylglucosamine reductase n=1 Tax=Zobellella endophytica TaxID=2116700 RepID=A0A2P7QWN1_9GAMM|nr:UDP-N-acetylmuramate dehydrogenase [Zobellella endophytica]PSJ42376.1 UDP-N-acetylenolpyruvoylglucosamine reductase [Zobellella endophytica]
MSTTPSSLIPFNTFGLEQSARHLVVLEQRSQLQTLWRERGEEPLLFVGEGSNLLFTAPFDGTVLVNRLTGITVTDAGDAWRVRAEGGENWHRLVCWTLAQGMPGLENLALIPGTVGAAPIQNIGAYGVELAQFCEAVESFDWQGGEIRHWSAADCRFGYRDSVFKHEAGHHLILSVTLRLPKAWQPVLGYGPLAELGGQASAQQIFEQVCTTRQAKLPDPKVLGNAGSFFKNPKVVQAQAQALRLAWPELPVFAAEPGRAKLAAGWLIDKAGLKGARVGGAGVHVRQALVLVNLGGATAEDVIRLATLVRERVEQQFGVRLEPEVRMVGRRGETSLDEALACLN